MPGHVDATTRVWVLLAMCSAVAGCASPGERVPQCKGRAAPINAVPPAAANGQAHVTDVATAESGDAGRGGSHAD